MLPLNLIFLFILPVSSFSLGSWLKKIWNSIPELIPQETEGSLEVVDDNYGLPSNGNIIAMGNFQSNLRMSVFFLDDVNDGGGGGAGVGVGGELYSMDENGTFIKLPNTRIKTSSSERVHNVIMSDLDHDGYCDLLVMMADTTILPSPSSMAATTIPPVLKLYIYRGDGKELLAPIEVPGHFIGEPMLVDLKSTMKMSLIGIQKSSSSSSPSDGRMSAWLNTAISDKDTISPPPIFGSPILLRADVKKSLSPLQWNHQVDIDGDGLADLIVYLPFNSMINSQQKIKIWKRTTLVTEGTPVFPFLPSIEIELPSGSGPLTVVDIDGDGNPDLLYSVCTSASDCHLEILFNDQIPFCSNIPSGSSDSCNKLSDGIFIDSKKEPSFLKQALKIRLPKDMVIPQLLGGDSAGGGGSSSIPNTFSIGDYNLDSFVDISISAILNGRLRKALLFENIPCTPELCPKHSNRRTLRLVQEGEKEFHSLFEGSDVDQVAFADWITSNGSPGFLLNRSSGGGTGALRTTVIRNKIIPGGETFFIRCSCLNGVEPSGNSDKNAEYPYGVGYLGGASFRMAFMDSQGVQQIRQHTQLSLTSNRSLQYPTVLWGLGRTSNYISQLTSSLPLSTLYGPSMMKSLSTIPNSQVVFIPPISSSNEYWRLELQISIVTYGWGVGVSLLISLLILASITTFFKWSEMREDEVERKRRSHLVNFDAL